LQAENDELRLQEAEDRRRLQHLMSLTHPVDQEVTLSRGAEPTSGVLYPRSGTTRQGTAFFNATGKKLQRTCQAHAPWD
jgi:hypothetical protein